MLEVHEIRPITAQRAIATLAAGMVVALVTATNGDHSEGDD